MLLKKISYFLNRKILLGFRIPRNAKVIDIGSGDKPFWRANVFMDRLDLKDLHRHTDTPPVITLGAFIDCDITKTPFRDKAFDFSFCAHLLEHVERPDLAIKEITRISKAGYIEVPNGVIEFISPFHSHLWFILQNKKKLIFIRKSKKQHKLLSVNSEKFYKIISKIEEPFIRLEWKNKIDFEIIDTEKKINKYYPPKRTPKTKKNYQILKYSTHFYNLFIGAIRSLYVVKNLNIKELMKSKVNEL